MAGWLRYQYKEPIVHVVGLATGSPQNGYVILTSMDDHNEQCSGLIEHCGSWTARLSSHLTSGRFNYVYRMSSHFSRWAASTASTHKGN
ncbi:hypothetical protein AVEN_49793-1 [Araneus ventricosus]|uniref:Uncharacterized protein n=1 Tax=Araneus ventricosus TaxID=182803 RepID=A0A4Y2V5P5_ARAVE|nr:hypothetical protein AVEN_49793-1 [Araneus ventricosus]